MAGSNREQAEPDRRNLQLDLERCRHYTRRQLDIAFTPLARGLNLAGLRPDHVSLASLLLSATAAALVAGQVLIWAGVVFLLAGLLDLLDGLMARSSQSETEFGAFLDSTIDRISDGLVLAAVVFYFARQGEAVVAGVAALALLASFLVSYTRSRAGELGIDCSTGWVTRAERVLLIVLGLVSGYLHLAIYLLAFLSAATALQRLLHVRHALRTRN